MNNRTTKKTHGGNKFIMNLLRKIPLAQLKNIAQKPIQFKPISTVKNVTQSVFTNMNRIAKNSGETYYHWYYRRNIPKGEWKGNETDRQIINRMFRERQDSEQYGTTIDNYFRKKMSDKEEIKELEISDLLKRTLHPEAKKYMEKIKAKFKVNEESEQRSAIGKTWDYLKFAVYTVKKSFWDNPIQIKYLNKTETFTALSTLINLNLTWDPDADEETMTQNYNNFYKNLIGTVLPILESTFDEYLKGGCEKTVPVILQHIFGDNIVSNAQQKINASDLAQNVLDKTYQTCNSIAPKIANQLKTHGFKDGIGKDAKQELIQYMEETTSLCKDFVIGAIEKKLIDVGEIFETALEEEIDKDLNKDINKSWIEKIFFKIKSEIEKFEKIDVKHAVTTMIDNLNQNKNLQKIEQEIATEINSKLETKVGNITIFDFYNNWRETTTHLLEAWTTEINEAIPDKEHRDGYYNAKCLLNVLDLRVSTIIDNVCKIYKSDSLLCDEKLIKDIDGVLTKDDIKGVLKNFAIHVFQTKKRKLIQELTYFEESIVFHYLSMEQKISIPYTFQSVRMPFKFQNTSIKAEAKGLKKKKRKSLRKITARKKNVKRSA